MGPGLIDVIHLCLGPVLGAGPRSLGTVQDGPGPPVLGGCRPGIASL